MFVPAAFSRATYADEPNQAALLLVPARDHERARVRLL